MVYLFHSTENNQGVFLYVFYVVEGHVLRSRLPGNKQSGGKRLSGKTRHQAISTGARPCMRWLGPFLTQKTIICQPSTTAWFVGSAKNKPSQHWPTRCWSLSITSCVPRHPIKIWVPITLTKRIAVVSSVTMFYALPQLGYTVTLNPKEAA